jgi:tRNA(fMet)-specific endonuclease VapC
VDEKMEDLICLDSSVLIDFYRKKRKETTFFYQLSLQYSGFVLPVVSHFEILTGSNINQHSFWENLFEDFIIIPYIPKINFTAIKISAELKKLRKLIDFKDLIIASTAMHYNYTLGTLNEKHFINIRSLKIITPSSLK